jgi:hypothetical protein
VVGGGQVVARHRQICEVVARELVAAHKRGEQGVGVALRRQDELPVLGEHKTLGVEAADRIRPATRLLQGRHGIEVHIAGAEGRPDVDADRVEASRVDLRLVVGEDVVEIPARVVRDRRQAPDRRPGEGRAGRDDRLPDELERRLVRSRGDRPGRYGGDGQRDDEARKHGKKPFRHLKPPL